MIAPPADVAMEKLGMTIEPAAVLDAISLFVAVIAVAAPLVNVDVGLVIAPDVTEVTELVTKALTPGTTTAPGDVP
jgi:hypothetical protein